jgi:hypothetical protein
MHTIAKWTVGLVVGATLVRPAWAGVEMSWQMVDLKTTAKGQKPPREARVLVEGDRLRLESKDGGVIYRGDRDLTWMLDAKQRSYVEVNRATAEQMHQKMDAARAQMQAQLDKMPAGQRAQIEKLMGQHGMGGVAAAAKPREAPTIKPTGKTDTVDGRSCREFEVYRGAEKESEVCVADWSAAGIAKDDLGVFKKFAAFQSDMLSGMSGGKHDGFGEDSIKLFDRLDGVPVRVRSFHGGAATMETRIEKIEKKAVDGASFEVPEGWAKRTPFTER